LFLCAGAVLHQTGTVDLDDLGGLSKRMPKTTVLFLIGAFSISGLPPFNGFVSKWMIYQAAYTRALSGGGLIFVFVTVVALVTSVLTLASFIKVAQSVFFGQLPEKYKDVQEIPFAMRAPMWGLAILCILTGIFPNLVYRYLLNPAASAVFSVFRYVEAAMGSNYAMMHVGPSVSYMDYITGYWDPVCWLVLLFVVLAAVTVVSLMGKKDRGKIREEESEGCDPKYEPFYGGEASEYSQVGGSDLFWGFKHNLKPYLTFMRNAHSGVVNDYALWGIAALALVILFAILWL
jgi:multicomponent Na+:H+ antiporter subunit D